MEVVIVLAVTGMILAPLAAILYQLIWIPWQRSDTLTALHDTRQAVESIANDARKASTFTSGTEPDYGTFGWLERTGGTVNTYSVRYYYSTADTSLMREATLNGSPQTTVVSGDIQNYGNISVQQNGDMVLVSATATIDSLRGALSRTASMKAQMRPLLPGAAPTPPPYTLAWDDFETGGWGGGEDWLADWYHTGDSGIVSTSGPYQGSYHLQLRRATGYTDRAFDLTGQTNVRLQFWAKASSFETGEFATLSVSSDDVNWTAVKTWQDGDDDDAYHFYDIDLSSFTMSNEFWVGFDAQMSDTSDYLWVDDIKVVKGW